jgi:hypothetical protein
MKIGNYSIPNNPFRLPRLIQDAKKIYDKYKGETIIDANRNDELAILLGYKSSNNGSFRAELSALRVYGLVEGKGDIKISDLGKKVTYGTGEEKNRAILQAVLNIPLWKQLYNRYRFELPSKDFWVKIQQITACESPVAQSNEKFITEAYYEDTNLIREVKFTDFEGKKMMEEEQNIEQTSVEYIEIKAGDFVYKAPLTEEGLELSKPYLSELLIRILQKKVLKQIPQKVEDK